MSDHRPGLAATKCQDRVDVSSQHSVVARRGERLDDGDFRWTGSAHLPDQGLDVWPAEELLELLRRFPLVHKDDEAVTEAEAWWIDDGFRSIWLRFWSSGGGSVSP